MHKLGFGLFSCLAVSFTGCVDQEAANAAVQKVGDAIVGGVAAFARTHPAVLRAELGLKCDAATACKDKRPVATECAAEPGIWSTTFGEELASCALTCMDGATCFDEAVAAAAIDEARSNLLADCRAALESCGSTVETDACEALVGLADPGIVQAIAACASSACDAMVDCYANAIWTKE